MDRDLMVTAFGRAVRTRRTERRLTLDELGELAGLSRRSIGEIERGRGNPRLDKVVPLIEALDLSVVEFATRWEDARRSAEGGPR
jgi:transcriptional regulator with XRE-family HTH domain